MGSDCDSLEARVERLEDFVGERDSDRKTIRRFRFKAGSSGALLASDAEQKAAGELHYSWGEWRAEPMAFTENKVILYDNDVKNYHLEQLARNGSRHRTLRVDMLIQGVKAETGTVMWQFKVWGYKKFGAGYQEYMIRSGYNGWVQQYWDDLASNRILLALYCSWRED